MGVESGFTRHLWKGGRCANAKVQKHVVTEEERLESLSVNSANNVSAAPFQAKTPSVYISDSPPQNQILSNRNLSPTRSTEGQIHPNQIQ